MKNKSERGFTYIDVMVAIVILSVGILALLAAITGAVVQSRGQEEQLDAKQIATSTMEAIMAVKETKTTATSLAFGWERVGNVGNNPDAGGNPQGIFVNGMQPVRINPGPDQIVGTGDDSGVPVPGFARRIAITDQCDPERPSQNCATPGDFDVKVRLVVITVTYNVGTIQRQEQLTTVLTDYAATN